MSNHPEMRGLISYPNVESALSKRRKMNIPSNPKSPQEAIALLEDRENHPFSAFYQGHVQYNNNIAILFAVNSHIDILVNCESGFVDATFKIATFK
jgi:hypothetical protein